MKMPVPQVCLFVLALAASLFCAVARAQTPLAEWRADAGEGNSLRLLDGADGQVAGAVFGGSKAATTRENTSPPSEYLYFDADKTALGTLGGPVYLLVEYYDKNSGGAISVMYDSAAGDATGDKYRPAEAQWGGWFNGAGAWRTVLFELRTPLLDSRQNMGADFRITNARLIVRRAALYAERPAVDIPDGPPARKRVSAARIGKGGRHIIGGFDPVDADSARQAQKQLDSILPVLRSMGVTSHEGYVRWDLCEPEPGRYDWSIYDGYVDQYKKHGLKWVPFLICGSAYSLPDWFYKKEGFQGYVCLEHGETSDVASLWNPVLREHLARFIQAFCEHYRGSGVVESILLGITGNYGEAIYIASGNDWTANTHGEYHTHSGFWAGDPLAMADFRRFLTEKYGTAEKLSAAWGSPVADIAQMQPFLRKDAPNNRAWLDFCGWYTGSMNDYCRFWLGNIRKGWDGKVEICTGGHAPAEHGADFGEQCKIAAEYGAGVRITNEGSDYRANFSLTRWVASAGRQYGAYYSFEPAGMVDTQGVIARVYNATASGAAGLHYYYPNIYGDDRARANWVRWAGEFRQRAPRTEIAVYYPHTQILLTENKFLEKVQPLRDCFDFAYRSDQQILDGGLKDVKALVIIGGTVAEKRVWDAVAAWQRNGGLVIAADGAGRLRTVEGDESVHDTVLGAGDGKGRAVVFAGQAEGKPYRDFLVDTLRGAPELSRATRAMIAADGREDRVFATVTGANRLLWLNYTAHPAKKAGKSLPPWSITTTALR